MLFVLTRSINHLPSSALKAQSLISCSKHASVLGSLWHRVKCTFWNKVGTFKWTYWVYRWRRLFLNHSSRVPYRIAMWQNKQIFRLQLFFKHHH